MKSKTLKDLGIDNGDKYLGKLSTEYDLGELGDLSAILDDKKKNKEEDHKETEKKMKEIKDDV